MFYITGQSTEVSGLMFISVYATLRQSTLITIGNNACVFGYIEERKNEVGRGQLIFFLMQKLNYCDNYFDFFFSEQNGMKMFHNELSRPSHCSHIQYGGH